MLAGISVDYLIRLEQGRDLSPSAAVLAALSDALRLDEDERRHLLTLVSVMAQSEMCPPAAPPSAVSSTTLALLDRLHPTPAFVLEGWAEVATWNPAYDRLMRPAGLFDVEPPNLARYMFLMPVARSLYRDWMTVASEQVRALQAATATCHVSRAFERLVGELSVHSTDFARLWARHDVGERRRGVHRMIHPVAGDMELEYEVLALPDPQARRLVTYLPANQASIAALDRLVADAGPRDAHMRRLRVVDGGAA